MMQSILAEYSSVKQRQAVLQRIMFVLRAYKRGCGVGFPFSKKSKLILASSRPGGKHRNFMDTKVPGNKFSQELARESLIAISQYVPDTVLASKSSSESEGTDAVELKESDTAEECRSKLISISYTEIKTSPATLGKAEI